MTPALHDRPLAEPASREVWRAWLETNYDSSPGIWLAVGKKGGTLTTLTYEQAVEEALRFNWIDSTVRRLDDHRFKQLYTPRKPGSTWAPSNKARVARLEAQGLLLPVAKAAIEAARADGSWDFQDTIDSMAVPDDLASALAECPGASSGFEALAPFQRKLALHWIATAKRPETRARRIEETVRAAAEGRPPR